MVKNLIDSGHTLTFPLTKLATSSLFSNTDREWSRLWTSQSQCLFTSSTAAPETQDEPQQGINCYDPSEGFRDGTGRLLVQLTAGDDPAHLRAGNLEEDAEGRDPGIGVQHGVQRPHQETCRDDKTESEHANLFHSRRHISLDPLTCSTVQLSEIK